MSKHSHHHDHHHCHHGHSEALGRLGFAFFLNFIFMLIEIVGGYLTGSIAILSDALHDFGDCIAIGMAFALERISKRDSSAQFSYGLRRLSLLSSGIIGGILLVGTFAILIVAIPRLLNPVQPNASGMMGLALLGIAINGVAAWRLWRGKTMNERAVSWHFLEDVLGWVAILIGSVVMTFWDFPMIDPILSIVFAIFILFGATKNLRRTASLFMQGVPESISVEEIKSSVLAVEHIQDLHDLHLWSLDGDQHVLTMHIVISEKLLVHELALVKENIRACIKKIGNIHTTIEVELPNEQCPDHNCGARA